MKYLLVACMLYLLLALHSACNGQKPVTVVAAVPPGDTVTTIGTNIRCVFQDADGNYWFATNGQGIYRHNGHTTLHYGTQHGLRSNYAWGITQDAEGTIWITTSTGMCRLNAKGIYTADPDTICHDRIDHLAESTLLTGNYYDGHTLQKFCLPRTSPLIAPGSDTRLLYDIYASLRDSRGRVWLGTCTAGLCLYTGQQYRWLTDKQFGAPIRCLYEDRYGNIWIGNNGYGLLRYHNDTLENVTEKLHLANPRFFTHFEANDSSLARVWSVTEDAGGDLWIGTIDAGLWRYRNGQITQYGRQHGLGSNAIWTVYRDHNNQMWIGTDGNGVYKWNGTTFTPFLKAAG
jgi:ligand-binding sensor domain-containing protein